MITEVLLTAVSVLLGLQILRILVPSVTWLLGDRMGLSSIELGAIVFVIFSTSFLAGSLRRLFGYRWSIVITAGGLGLVRLFIQIRWDDPLINFVLAIIGTVLLILFLPVCLEEARLKGGAAIGHFILGLLLGLTLDTTLHGAFNTYDAIWQPGFLPLLIALVLVLIQWITLVRMVTVKGLDNVKPKGSQGFKSIIWTAMGPFLFLQLVIFQNIARLTVLTGWASPIVFSCILLAQVVGLIVVVWLFNSEHRNLWIMALAFGTLLLLTTLVSNPPEAWLVTLTVFVGQISLTMLIALVIVGMSTHTKSKSISSITLGNGLAMIVLVVLLLGYYLVYQVNLPYSNTILEPIAAGIIIVCALASTIGLRLKIKMDIKSWLVPGLAIALLVLPAIYVINWHEPKAIAGSNFPIRVMTYNLHNGFDTDGYLGIEAIARVIEDSNCDIIALNEVSRGWVVSGRLDMLTWLSQRLNMPYVYGPTADSFWGNAILSLYPIIDYSNHDLPPDNLFILRGFTSMLVDLGGDRLQIIVTHFHHIEQDSDVRKLQSQNIIDYWNGANSTVLLGDLNANPDDPEMDMLRKAGLVDAMAGEHTSAYTYPSTNPSRRIDYIFISPDLIVQETRVLNSTASDHLPVVAVVHR